jgi:hypothetical protein
MLIERMRKRLAADRARFIEPCLPSHADKPPSGANRIHEIKHDGFRLMARRDPVGIRLITRRGHDWAQRYPLVVEAVLELNGADLRREPIEVRKATLASILRRPAPECGSTSTWSTPTHHRLPARLQDGAGGDCLEALWIALPIWQVAGLAEVQEPGGARGDAGGGGGLGAMKVIHGAQF